MSNLFFSNNGLNIQFKHLHAVECQNASESGKGLTISYGSLYEKETGFYYCIGNRLTKISLHASQAGGDQVLYTDWERTVKKWWQYIMKIIRCLSKWEIIEKCMGHNGLSTLARWYTFIPWNPKIQLIWFNVMPFCALFFNFKIDWQFAVLFHLQSRQLFRPFFDN